MSTASINPGDVLAGKYRVERVLGAGGMGYVVAARHLQLDQLVALKFLKASAVENSDAGKRFLREAKAVVKLRNEHVAKVYDVGNLDTGEPYIVMEYLEGQDLATLAKQRPPFVASEAAEYIVQACEGLAEAHALGIIHRDIKLANIFVTRGPANAPLVKVLDFGISKTNPFGESEDDMTRTAAMLGSPRFMSPEQMRDARAVDGRSDLWSLGVVLYRLVAGRPPFEAATLGRLLTMVMHEPEAPLSTIRGDLPPGFGEVVARCLLKDPAARFQNVAELAHALAPFCPDPMWARSAADRIAGMLSVRVDPRGSNTADPTGPVQGPVGRASAIFGTSEPGTTPPWAGTHEVAQQRTSNTTAWLGVALAALLVGTGIFAKVRHDANAHAMTSDATASRNEPTSGLAATEVPQGTLPNVAEPPATPTVVGVSSPVPAPQTTTPQTETPANAKRPTASPRAKSTAPARTVAPVEKPKNDDGIPATRD